MIIMEVRACLVIMSDQPLPRESGTNWGRRPGPGNRIPKFYGTWDILPEIGGRAYAAAHEDAWKGAG